FHGVREAAHAKTAHAVEDVARRAGEYACVVVCSARELRELLDDLVEVAVQVGLLRPASDVVLLSRHLPPLTGPARELLLQAIQLARLIRERTRRRQQVARICGELIELIRGDAHALDGRRVRRLDGHRWSRLTAWRVPGCASPGD